MSPDQEIPVSSRSPSPAGAGFTMLELLVAIAVLSILVVLLAGLVDSATKLWRENENRVDAFREARAALAVITRDLNSMVASTNANYFSLTNVGATNSFCDTNGLYFLTRIPPSSQDAGNKSELCAVGYYRRWSPQNDGLGQTNAADPTKSGYHLYRSFYGSDQTYSNLLANKPPLEDLQKPLSGKVQPEILARNILSVEFRCFETNATYTNPATLQAYRLWTNSSNNPLPQMIEVRLTAISDEAAKKLDGDQSRWITNDKFTSKEIRTFLSRIMLPTPEETRRLIPNQP